MRATGLKKCRPTRRDGLRRASPRAVRARCSRCWSRAPQSVSACGSRRAYSSRFASRFSKIASMTTSALRDAVALHVGLQARQRLIALRLHRDSASRRTARALERRRDVFRFAILQRHGQAARRAPRRNVAAHDACADDVHVLGAGSPPALPADLSRSCRKNTRTRLREVGVHSSSRHRARFGFIARGRLCRRAAATARSTRTEQGSDRGARAARPARASARRASGAAARVQQAILERRAATRRRR